MLAQFDHARERTFVRRFREATGVPPGVWLINARVERARELLELPGISIEEVARLSGFGSPATMRLHFRRQLGTNPTEYRQQFGAPTEPAANSAPASDWQDENTHWRDHCSPSSTPN